MTHPLKHAESSAWKFGGKPSDYPAVHSWFDESKAHLSDLRHRALRHHTVQTRSRTMSQIQKRVNTRLRATELNNPNPNQTRRAEHVRKMERAMNQ
jgi:hypothetical protein